MPVPQENFDSLEHDGVNSTHQSHKNNQAPTVMKTQKSQIINRPVPEISQPYVKQNNFFTDPDEQKAMSIQ